MERAEALRNDVLRRLRIRQRLPAIDALCHVVFIPKWTTPPLKRPATSAGVIADYYFRSVASWVEKWSTHGFDFPLVRNRR